uniref:Uncharacterized protein n=1 Tax=Noccaea caerulescens TaxID=107243 RepID=A0A1J3IUV9_NOCCA
MMVRSIVSSIIFFLLLVILSHCVHVKAFAAQMEHRKLSGGKESMTVRRNLEENGLEGSKIATRGSKSRKSLSYKPISRRCNYNFYSRCERSPPISSRKIRS